MSIAPRDIGLTASDTASAGLSRKPKNDNWVYQDSRGKHVSQKDSERITSLAIPPAWQNVWISPDPNTHILAYGDDEKGRRQYIYHPKFREARELAKFSDLTRFAKALPRLRNHIGKVLSESDDAEDLAIAAIIRLLDETGLRIGHKRFRRSSGTRGLTTLTQRNVDVRGDEIHLKYVAKGGKKRDVVFQDAQVAAVLKQLEEEPGRDVFSGEDFSIHARHVNAYIRNTMGADFSAKDFRTWGGSVVATEAIRKKDAETLKAVSEDAAEYLGNTATIAKSSYIHPAILDLVRSGDDLPPSAGPSRLYANERACFGIIDAHQKFA